MSIEKINRKRNMTAKEAGVRFGRSPRTIRRLVAQDRGSYEQCASERRSTAAKLRRQGLSWAEIADRMKTTEWAVRALVKRHASSTKKAGP